MSRPGVWARPRSPLLIAAVLLAVSACGDDSPEAGWRDADSIAPIDETAATGRTDRSSASTSTTTITSTATTGSTATPDDPEPTSPPSTTTNATSTSTVPQSTSTSAPTTTEPRIARRHVLIIGDSSAAAMRWTGGVEALRGAEFTLDAESCRRLVEPSCPGVEGYRPSTALDALRIRAGGDHDTLLIGTGYNDMDRDFDEAFELIYAEARDQDIETILWLTYREDVGFQLPSGSSSAYAEMND